MNKYTYTNTMPYKYDPNHKGAHYYINDSEKAKNGGEFAESVAKWHRGLYTDVNPNTSYDTGSDIEEMNASVKSSNASLARVYGTYEEIKKTYFANVHSTLWIYIVIIDEEVTEYHMNASEFETFLDNWHEMARESGSHLSKVRIKKTSGKMIKWLEERV